MSSEFSDAEPHEKDPTSEFIIIHLIIIVSSIGYLVDIISFS